MAVDEAPLYMLDTDICSYVLKKHSKVLDRRILNTDPRCIVISAVTRAEMLFGIGRVPDAVRKARVVHAFLAHTKTLPWAAGAADWYAKIRCGLERRGERIGDLDMMIAAHALHAGAILVTNNLRHYERIEDHPLAVTNWT